jgi:trimethylamine monooxygenase
MASEIKYSKQRVAIIGAGPSGLAALRAFKSAANKGQEIPQVTCFEKQDEIGGLWTYTWHDGLDKNGNPCQGSMYSNLWANNPKECLEFADYTFDDHYGKVIPSFPPREVVFDYVKGCATKANVLGWVKLTTVVCTTCFDEKTQLFTVVSRNLKTEVETTEQFDWIVVASGHFSVPSVPEWPGFDKFEGRIMHAHDFHEACEFKGKDILIIGTG